jgi:hypothetical protein
MRWRIVASEEHEFDPKSVLAPLLNLVEVAAVGIGFFGGPTVVGRRSPKRSGRTHFSRANVVLFSFAKLGSGHGWER